MVKPFGQPETDTKQRILDAADEIFVRRGIDGARMQEIADQAGVTPGGVRVVSTGAGGHGCHASRPPARGRDVPGARSRRTAWGRVCRGAGGFGSLL